MIKLCSIFSYTLPYKIIANSSEAKYTHREAGYIDNIMVISNGFSIDEFAPNIKASRDFRFELGVPENTAILGMVGRYDSQKNHSGFFEIASIIHKTLPDVHFCLVGASVHPSNQDLLKLVEGLHIPSSHFHLMGVRKDIPRLMAGFDVLALPSEGESFPNVVGEAMCSGTPCVVTDVGACAEIVGDTGRIVKVGDIEKFAMETIELLSLNPKERQKLGKQARMRIKTHFSLESSAKQFRVVLANSIKKKR